MSGTYSLYGLNIRSDYPLPAPPAHAAPDLVVTAGAPRAVPNEAPPGPQIAGFRLNADFGSAHVETDSGYLLRYFRHCEFELSRDLRQMTAHEDPAAPPGYLELILTGGALSVLLNLKGHTVLHASAVAHEGRTWVMAGDSGGGKSSLATTLCLAGARAITDDVLALAERGEQVMCLRGGYGIRVRPHSGRLIEALAGQDTADSADGRIVYKAPLVAEAVNPISAILLPQLIAGLDHAQAQRLPEKDAFFRLLGLLRTASWTHAPVAETHFKTLGKLAKTVPVIELRLPNSADWLIERFAAELAAVSPRA